MPTGILRDIWISLSSLGDHRPSKLEKLWIRFHDNQAALNDAGLVQPTTENQTPTTLPAVAATNPHLQQGDLLNPERYGVTKIAWTDHQLETPSFSIMPALRSLSVLEIDELRYLVELSTLLRRSLRTLRELRLGLATTLHIPPSAKNEIDTASLFHGGVWALLMCRIYDSIASGSFTPEASTNLQKNMEGLRIASSDSANDISSTSVNEHTDTNEEAIDPALCHTSEILQIGRVNLGTMVEPIPSVGATAANKLSEAMESLDVRNEAHGDNLMSHEKLRLEVLEIEKLTRLDGSILSRAIDLTVLSSLTFLHCGDQSVLWDRLRTDFAPRKTRITPPHSGIHGTPPRKELRKTFSDDMEYQLRLKRIHTDAVSSELVSFLKNTLASNSLEHMFLQDTEKYPSPVTLEAIYRGPLRRHRASLTKVLIDSSYGSPSSRLRSATARKWMLNRNVLTFVTSGKMCKLRELATAIEYKDWHHFLQRLPNIPHLRSLYIPMIYDHPYGGSLNVKDFALGAIDIVALKPEVQLCYLGIKNKCFEILEVKHKDRTMKGPAPPLTDEESDNDTQDDDHNDDEDDSEDGGAAAAPQPTEPGAMDSCGSITTEEDEQEAPMKKKINLKLREILFYDDKISIFKARHGRL